MFVSDCAGPSDEGKHTGWEAVNNATCRGTSVADSIGSIICNLDPGTIRSVDINAKGNVQDDGNGKAPNRANPAVVIFENAAQAHEGLFSLIVLVLADLRLAKGRLENLAMPLHLRAPAEPCQGWGPSHPVDVSSMYIFAGPWRLLFKKNELRPVTVVHTSFVKEVNSRL